MRAHTVAFAVIALGFGGTVRAAGQDRPPLYYQDPDGKPFYAAGPAKTADGLDYAPVFVDGATTQEPTSRPSSAKPAGGDHRILYFRNPMGLPDTSPKPKKDAMGMNYLPVYADEGTPRRSARYRSNQPQSLADLGCADRSGGNAASRRASRSGNWHPSVRRAAPGDGHNQGAGVDRASGGGGDR
jgi:hypothetical protein